MHASPTSSCNSMTPTCAAPNAADGVGLQKSIRASVLQSLHVSSATGSFSIAEAIRGKLGKAEPATDPVADVMKAVDDALKQAAKTFAAEGIDQKSIDAALEQFRGNLAREIDSLARAGEGKVDAVAARQVVKEKLSLDIVTAENDRVSIRFRSTEITEFAAAKASTDNGTALVAGAHAISRGRLQIEVKGDLNEAELAAIGDLLDKVNGIAEEFFAGDVQAAFAAASRVDFDSEALSGFDLRLRYSQSTAYARQYSDTAATSSPKPPVAVTPLATTAPVTAGPAVAELVEPVVDTIDVPSAPVTDAPAETSVPQTTGSAKTTMLSFAKDVLARLDSVADAGSVRFSLRWKVDFLLTAISASAATKPEAQPAVGALSDTLNQAVAVS